MEESEALRISLIVQQGMELRVSSSLSSLVRGELRKESRSSSIASGNAISPTLSPPPENQRHRDQNLSKSEF